MFIKSQYIDYDDNEIDEEEQIYLLEDLETAYE